MGEQIRIGDKMYDSQEWQTRPLSDIGEQDPDAPDASPFAEAPGTRLPEPAAGSVEAASLALRRAAEKLDIFGEG
jgi:hypothetical protein